MKEKRQMPARRVFKGQKWDARERTCCLCSKEIQHGKTLVLII